MLIGETMLMEESTRIDAGHWNDGDEIRQTLLDPRTPTLVERCNYCLVWSLDLDQEVADERIVLDSSRYTGETAQVPDGHGSWSCDEVA